MHLFFYWVSLTPAPPLVHCLRREFTFVHCLFFFVIHFCSSLSSYFNLRPFFTPIQLNSCWFGILFCIWYTIFSMACIHSFIHPFVHSFIHFFFITSPYNGFSMSPGIKYRFLQFTIAGMPGETRPLATAFDFRFYFYFIIIAQWFMSNFRQVKICFGQKMFYHSKGVTWNTLYV